MIEFLSLGAEVVPMVHVEVRVGAAAILQASTAAEAQGVLLLT
jgi:hypothetical protein